MARFRGITEHDGFIDNRMLHGNAFQIMNAANEFIMRHLPVASFFDDTKLERIDKPLLPVLAIREALSNAICHRDYSIHNAAMTLAIFDDRMEIWNNGVLPTHLSLDDLKKRHKSYPRNKHIARIFYLRGHVETWGTGTTKMVTLCKENDIPEPVFDEYSGGFSVVFKFKELIGSTTSTSEIVTTLSKRQQVLFEIIKGYGEISMDRIISELQDPPSRRMLQKDLNQIKDKGMIELKGSGRGATWKYISGNAN